MLRTPSDAACATSANSNSSSNAPTLGCCEYIDVNGGRRQIVQCMCECEALDDAADALLSGQSSSRWQEVRRVVKDRIRIPWCFGGGALRVDPSLIFAFVAVRVVLGASTLLALTISPTSAAVMLLLMHVYILFQSMEAVTSVAKASDPFFAAWLASSLFWLFSAWWDMGTASSSTVKWCSVLLSALLMATSFAATTFAPKSLMKVRRRHMQKDTPHSTEGKSSAEIVSDMYLTTDIEKGASLCGMCDYFSFRCDRAKHCRVTRACIRRYDHYCVWTHCAIGGGNHRQFIFFLVSACANACYFIFTTWLYTGRNQTWPWEKRMVYISYAAILGIVTLGLLLSQLYQISKNVTTNELLQLRRKGTSKWKEEYAYLLQRNVWDQGFVLNWYAFALAWESESILFQVKPQNSLLQRV